MLYTYSTVTEIQEFINKSCPEVTLKWKFLPFFRVFHFQGRKTQSDKNISVNIFIEHLWWLLLYHIKYVRVNLKPTKGIHFCLFLYLQKNFKLKKNTSYFNIYEKCRSLPVQVHHNNTSVKHFHIVSFLVCY